MAKVATLEAWFGTMGISISDNEGNLVTLVIEQEQPELYAQLSELINKQN